MIKPPQEFRFTNTVLDQDRGLFSNYWQRALADLYFSLKRLIAGRNTGVTSAIATGTLIDHGMAMTPAFVTLAPQDGTPTNYFADNITTTQFRINYTGGGTHAFGWSAET